MGQGRMNGSTGASRPKIALLCGLAMVLAALGFRLLRPGPTSGLAASPAPAATPPGNRSTPEASVEVARTRNVIRWPDEAARDPFRSTTVYPPQPVRVEPVKEAPAAMPVRVDVAALARASIHLKGTIQGERPVAMVNGRVCRVGETVDGFRIVAIGKRSIAVEQDGTRVVIEAE